MSSPMNKELPQSVQGDEKQRKYGAFQNEVYKGALIYLPLPKLLLTYAIQRGCSTGEILL